MAVAYRAIVDDSLIVAIQRRGHSGTRTINKCS